MRFSKMHGLSNDFVIIDSITQRVYLNSDKVKFLSDRNCGIGFNQLLVIEPPYDPIIDFHCRIYNSDGSEANQCGNGIRCVARFVYMKNLTNKHVIKISTRSGNVVLSAIHEDLISVNMGEPVFDPKLIPFYAERYLKTYILFLPSIQTTVLCGVVSMGNPHCIILVNTVESVAVTKLGSILETHHCFPKRVNVSFMQIINHISIKLRVYERGVGETQACGTAACAAVAIGIQQGLLTVNKSIQVSLPGGKLFVSWKGQGHPLYMMGSTTYVYDGFVYL